MRWPLAVKGNELSPAEKEKYAEEVRLILRQVLTESQPRDGDKLIEGKQRLMPPSKETEADAARLYGRGYTLYWEGKYEQALSLLEASCALDNSDARAWYYRSLAEWALQDKAQADESLKAGGGSAPSGWRGHGSDLAGPGTGPGARPAAAARRPGGRALPYGRRQTPVSCKRRGGISASSPTVCPG